MQMQFPVFVGWEHASKKKHNPPPISGISDVALFICYLLMQHSGFVRLKLLT
jgi:hypothetical protein